MTSKVTRAQVVKIANKVVSKRTELKRLGGFLNTTFDDITTAGQELNLLDDISQGDGQNQRVGNNIELKNLTLRGVLRSDSSLSTCTIRFIIAFVDVDYTFATSPVTVSTDINPCVSSEAIQNILYDKSFTINTMIAANYTSRAFNISIPLRKKKIKYDQAAATQTHTELHIYAVSDSPASGTNPMMSHGFFRLTYYDT